MEDEAEKNPPSQSNKKKKGEESEQWIRKLLEEIVTEALAGVSQWIELWPVNQRVTGSIPSQGTRLGYGPGPQFGGA